MVEAAREKALGSDESLAVAEAAETFRAAWRCPRAGHSPSPDPSSLPDSAALPLRSLAADAQRVMGLADSPCTCPFAPLYDGSDAFTRRTVEAVALMDDGAPAELIFPSGPFAVDRDALLILKAAKVARDRSDQAIHEEESKRRQRQSG